jgi:hypothetical protein
MTYEVELDSLRAWVEKHPGLNFSQHRLEISAVPFPSGTPGSWKPPYEGTRMSHDVPSLDSIEWKLRYLELCGDVRQERGRWFRQ